MSFDLSGRTALVTGSTRGIGLAIAQALAGAGARVAINGRTAEAVDAVVAELEGAVASPFDVTDESAVAPAVATLGPVDVLVNNTGIALRRPLLELESDEWRQVLDVNLTSAFLVSRAVVPGMIERGGGKIVNVCSLMSELARPTTGAYAATKGALKMLTRSMCAEWAPHGIQANGIAPGYIRTDLTEPLQADAEFDAWLRARVPAGRWGEPAELGGAVVFLASSASDFVNGQLLVVRGATVFPGDGPPRQVDVGIADGTIAAVGGELNGDDVVAGEGLWLCPGFIDLHAHSALRSFDDPLLTEVLAQGITTQVINPDGLAPAPVTDDGWADRRDYLTALEGSGPGAWPWRTFADYLDALDATRPAISLVPSIGAGAARDTVIGGERRPATAAELDEMRHEVRTAFEAGASNLSFGLVYFPGAHAGTDELVALAEVAAEFGAPLVPHLRNEGTGVLDAVDEMLDISRRSGASLHVSHLKSMADETLIEPLLEKIDGDGVTFDQYPYGAGCTLLASLLPAWAQEGGAAATLERLRDPEVVAGIAHEVDQGVTGWENILGTVGPERITVDGEPVGSLERVVELLLESELGAQMILHYASDEAVREIAAHPRMLLGSDGIFGAHPHPRVAGSAARFLGRFALKEKLLPAEEAIARLTARAADRFGLKDRGRIEVGKRADLVLLDPEAYVDTATYEEPLRLAEGVTGVWVAAERAWAGGAPTGSRTGGVVR